VQKYVLPYTYQLEQESKTARKKIRLNQQREVEIYKADLLNTESIKIEAETKKVEAEKELSQTKQRAAKADPTILWDEDYERFKKTRFFGSFGYIREAVYEHNGRHELSEYRDGIKFKVGSELLAYADTEELIVINQSSDTISLTTKGKYFVKRYQQEDSF